MTKLVAIDDSLDMGNFDLDPIHFPTQVNRDEMSMFFYVWAQSWLHIFGKDFGYNQDGAPIRGTITSLYGVDLSGNEYFMSDFRYDLKKLYRIATSTQLADDMALKEIMSGDDKITGGSGDDVAKGFNGSDMLLGKRGYDTLNGGSGNDILIGGHDRDLLRGAAGADVFVFRRASDSNLKHSDKISDFSHGNRDTIDLSAIGHLSFIGDQDFHHARMELRAETHDGTTTVQADLDGDGEADLQIYLSGEMTLRKADFVL